MESYDSCASCSSFEVLVTMKMERHCHSTHKFYLHGAQNVRFCTVFFSQEGSLLKGVFYVRLYSYMLNYHEVDTGLLHDSLRRWQLPGVCTLCMHEKEPPPPQNTSEHVKSQHFLGSCPQTPFTQSI